MIRPNRKINVPDKIKHKSLRKNINGNFRGHEDRFFKAVRDGLIEFLRSPWK
jgi:hypothetical protein